MDHEGKCVLQWDFDYMDYHSLRQARFRQVTGSILRVLSVFEIPGSMMYTV